jgi:hypothetical protein
MGLDVKSNRLPSCLDVLLHKKTYSFTQKRDHTYVSTYLNQKHRRLSRSL